MELYVNQGKQFVKEYMVTYLVRLPKRQMWLDYDTELPSDLWREFEPQAQKLYDAKQFDGRKRP